MVLDRYSRKIVDVFLRLAVCKFLNFLCSSDQIPCHSGLLADIDGCKCTVEQFEPSKHVLSAFHKQCQRCPQHRTFEWTEIRKFETIRTSKLRIPKSTW